MLQDRSVEVRKENTKGWSTQAKENNLSWSEHLHWMRVVRIDDWGYGTTARSGTSHCCLVCL